MSEYLAACPHRRWELTEPEGRNPWASSSHEWVCGFPGGGVLCSAATPREPENCPRFARAKDHLCPECLADHRAAAMIQDQEPQAGAAPLLVCLHCGASWTPEEHRTAMVATLQDMLADLQHDEMEARVCQAAEAARLAMAFPPAEAAALSYDLEEIR